MESNSIPDRILQLIAGKVSGKLSEAERLELDSWLLQNPGLREDTKHTEEAMLRLRWTYLAGKTESEKHYWKTRKEIAVKERSRKVFFRWTKYAALILILVVSAAAFYFLFPFKEQTSKDVGVQQLTAERNQNAILVLSDGQQKILNDAANIVISEREKIITNKPGEMLTYENDQEETVEPIFNKLITPAGSRYQLQLSDGTKVWLNSMSQLDYPVDFIGDERKVRLEGEAYFEVTKDPQKTFVVEIENYQIRVLGTGFNVYAYADDAVMETTLVEGSVLLSSNKGKDYILETDQQARASNGQEIIEIRKVEPHFYTSWKDGVLYFNKMKLSELARRLERWYNVDIRIEGEATGELLFSGAVENSKSVDYLLELISKTTQMEYVFEPEEIIIK